MLAGSSGLLAVDTLGFSSAEAERSVSVDVVDDPNAFLSLTEDGDGVETGGLLFEDENLREAPETFHLLNQLTEPMTVSFESDAFEFDPDETDLPIGEDTEVTVDLPSLPDDPAGATDAIGITAEGDSTRIEAERLLRLVPEAETFAFTVCRGESDNCVDVTVTVGWDETAFDVTVTVDSDGEDMETYGDRLESGKQETFDLNLKSGNWNVTDTSPNPEKADESGPGDPVGLEKGPISVKLHPVAGVSVTVSVSP
ncbi:hypothetical protein SAMN05444422_10227 [Halobiforma haloterrestris]|uniref:Uncharacterized protein n=2 Tax=Natronobacterium haloterrestre TaxID=148448 RepID=A0A1I1DW50_NATHA|nr:hypothetical protein SAMN05444422_10227 [Halobiforma haloterrestris]